jgi:hypothetical protein
MNEWLVGIAVAVMSVVLIDIIIAEGETKKYIKGVASLFVLVAVLSPLSNLKGVKFDLTSVITDSSNTIIDTSYLTYINDARRKRVEDNIKILLSDENIVCSYVRVELKSPTNEFEISAVEISITKSVINNNDENINIIEVMKDKIAVAINIEKDIIRIFYDLE